LTLNLNPDFYMNRNELIGNKLFKLREIARIGSLPFSNLAHMYKHGLIGDCGFVNRHDPLEPLFTSAQALEIIGEYRNMMRSLAYADATAQHQATCRNWLTKP
jgi:hypothetical protein